MPDLGAGVAGDCGKYKAELHAEVAKGRLTLAELDEEEQSLDRLRRWYPDDPGQGPVRRPHRGGGRAAAQGVRRGPHHSSPWVIFAVASAGAIIGDNIGFWVGDKGGYRLARPLRAPDAAG